MLANPRPQKCKHCLAIAVANIYKVAKKITDLPDNEYCRHYLRSMVPLTVQLQHNIEILDDHANLYPQSLIQLKMNLQHHAKNLQPPYQSLP